MRSISEMKLFTKFYWTVTTWRVFQCRYKDVPVLSSGVYIGGQLGHGPLRCIDRRKKIYGKINHFFILWMNKLQILWWFPKMSQIYDLKNLYHPSISIKKSTSLDSKNWWPKWKQMQISKISWARFYNLMLIFNFGLS